MNILITGATGNLGSKIVKHVLELNKDHHIMVSVRNVEKAAALKQQGVEVRHGDFDDPASLDVAFAGVDRLVIVSTDGDTPTRIKQHKNAIEAALKAQVKRIVYTSLTNADTSELVLAEVHKDTEKRLIASGINYKILRNNWYLENEIDSIKEGLATGTITSAYGEGKLGWLLRDEYAEAAAHAVLLEDNNNHIYTLSNTLATIDEFAATLSDITGKTISVNHITDEQYAAGLKAANLPEGVVDFVVAISRGIREGSLATTSNDFQQLTGHQPQTLKESLSQLINNLD